MDLNYLLHRQQIERIRAEFAASGEARQAHAELASLYEQAIEERTMGRLRFVTAHAQTIH
jgi:hypothetical protein